MRAALAQLRKVAPAPPATVPLPAAAPFGAVALGVAGCTLCLACVGACPTGALAGNPERPQLIFHEEACVQCGLCKATCPERVISLLPRLNPAAAAPVVLKEEEPFPCIRCGKPFGTRSMIERVVRQLAGKQGMFRSERTLRLIQMCENCRVAAPFDRAVPGEETP